MPLRVVVETGYTLFEINRGSLSLHPSPIFEDGNSHRIIALTGPRQKVNHGDIVAVTGFQQEGTGGLVAGALLEAGKGKDSRMPMTHFRVEAF